MTKGTRAGGPRRLPPLSLPGALHVWAKELLVLLLRVAALSGLLMRSWERRERTCSGTYLATCPTSRGERDAVPSLAGQRCPSSLVQCRQASGGTLCGAGGDKEGGLWGQHGGDRSGCPA